MKSGKIRRFKQQTLRIMALLSLFLLFSCFPGGSSDDSGQETLNPYQRDFQKLSAYIRRTHAGFRGSPLTIMDESGYIALTRAVIDNLESTESRDDFLIEISWFFEKLNDGHTRVYFPFKERAPLTVAWLGDKLHIIAVGEETYAPLLYGEILRVGDRPVGEYESLINGYIPSDRDHLLAKRSLSQEVMFTRAFLAYFGLLSGEDLLELEVSTKEGVQKVRVPCCLAAPGTRSVINEKIRTALTAPSEENRWVPLENEEAVYLQLNHLRGKVDRDLYGGMFAFLSERGWSRLIVDLRNNGGGNSLWCNEFLSYLTEEEREIYLYRGWESHYPGKDRERGDGMTRIAAQKEELVFDGEVVFLTSPYTFSSATFFVVAALDNGLGTVIGEPPGNTSLRYGYRAQPVTLPRTGLKFYTTHHIWGRAKPGMMNEGEYIEPDIPVSPTLEDMKQGRDGVFEAALAYLTENA